MTRKISPLVISQRREVGQGGQNQRMEIGCNVLYSISTSMSKPEISKGKYISYAFHTRLGGKLIE